MSTIPGKHRVMTVFGIRPDFIRASVLLKKMIRHPRIDLQFVYTGQHYDDKLMGIFFRELQIPPPTFVLDATGATHPQQHAKLITQLEEAIEMARPDVCLFLGDANAVIGCITPLKMGIPIAHVEAGMRSYDWRMPEERNRVIIDRVSDVLYCYQQDYKYRLIQEGINPTKIVVTGNTIVDVIKENEANIQNRMNAVLDKFGVQYKKFGIMTLHRDQTMNDEGLALFILRSVNRWAVQKNLPIILITMPRLKKILQNHTMHVNMSKFIPTEPLGMFDYMALEKAAAIEFTDSGTNQETSTIFGTPCVVTRTCTERPETFDSGICGMSIYHIGRTADAVFGKTVKPGYSLGDGRAADIIIDDLVSRLDKGFNTVPSCEDPFIKKHFSSY
jgi:UDP-N-acetylglucosamine 2-epimerase